MSTDKVGPCIEVSGVSKVYRAGTAAAVEAVSTVSFTVPQGQFVAILGPSGCGKSTLLMMVGGLEAVSSGLIIVDGKPMIGPRTSIGVMFQDPTLLPWKSALDNVLFPVRVLKRSIEDHREAANNLLQQVGLNGFEHKRPHELSGGMRQRVAICRTLVYDPDVLLMDEPFSALDEITRAQLQDDLLQLWSRERKTVVFVTHNISEAVYLADRVVVMSPHPGRIKTVLAPGLARPRLPELHETPEFMRWTRNAREAFKT
jgi:NitT/TauT family transport system ATP-binding protein